MGVNSETSEESSPVKKTLRKPTIIRRSSRLGEGEPCRVQSELENGVKVYRCPLCNSNPFTSELKIRRHLKVEHEESKVVVLDAVVAEEDYADPLQGDSKSISRVGNAETRRLLKRPNVAQKRETPEDKESHGGRAVKRRKEVVVAVVKVEDEEVVDGDLLVVVEDPEPDTNYSEEIIKSAEKDCYEPCGLCCKEQVNLVEADSVDQIFIEQEPLRNVVNSALGLDFPEKYICSDCETLSSYIGHTKIQVLKLQNELKDALCKLRDLYTLGRELVEEDLGDVGLGEQEMIVRLVQDSNPPSRSLRNLGLSVGSSYLGTGVTGPDDRSMVHEVNAAGEESCLFITQEEWASSGLTVREGRVQVPDSLIRGVCVGKDRPRFLLSRGLCTEMADKTFLCLDCDESFVKLGELMEHAMSHETADIQLQEEPVPELLSPVTDQSSISSSLSSKIEKLKGNPDNTEKLEFKAYMHKEQFKEFNNDVPTLDKPFQCTECNKVFASAHDLWGHQVSVGSQTFDCNYSGCNEIFLKLPDFAVHYAAHSGQNLVIPNSIADKKVLNIVCPICGTLVTGLYKLQRHKMKHDAELKYKCPACPKQFVKANTMRKHIASVHKGAKAQKQCHLCESAVYSDAGLALHLKVSHGLTEAEVVRTPKGDSVFKNEDEQTELARSNSRPASQELQPGLEPSPSGRLRAPPGSPQSLSPSSSTRETCPECAEPLTDGEEMTDHLRRVHCHTTPRFQCSECELKLTTLQGCRKHFRMVHRGAPLTCVLCMETFPKESVFHQHLASSHTDVLGPLPLNPRQPVICKICEASFPVYMDMVVHARHNHFVQTIDISSTQLEEVTMIGGHVVEYGEDGSQIVALHTIP